MIPRTKVNYSLKDITFALCGTLRRDARHHNRLLVGQLCDLFGAPHIALMPSGRAGLYFILRALEQPRVIIPAYTCKAVVEAATMAGKEVLYVETERGGFNMDPQDVRTKADANSIIIATHQFGIPCDIERIMEIARHCGAIVIEDAAASFGSRHNHRLTGTFGDAAFFSFDSTKIINVPLKGGFILIKRKDLFDRIGKLVEHDIQPMPWHVQINYLLGGFIYLLLENHLLYRVFHTLNFVWRGRFTADTQKLNLKLTDYYQYAMTDWQAGLAAMQLTRCEDIFQSRRALYQTYWHDLQNCQSFQLPPQDKAGQWVCTRFPIRVRGDKLAFYRDSYRRGVDMAFSFTFIASPSTFVESHRLAQSVLDIPYYFKLKNSELKKVVNVLQTTTMEPASQ